MEVTHTIKIDMVRKGVAPRVYAMQGDSARLLEVSLYKDDAQWNIPSGASIYIAFRGSTGEFFRVTTLADGSPVATYAENIARVTLPPELTAGCGEIPAVLVFLDGSGKQIATFPVSVYVTCNPAENASEANPVSPDEFTQLMRAITLERSRIDNLATLKEGSTSGDAELRDIRVGKDGTIYPNAGAAVREQFAKAEKLMGDIQEDELSRAYCTAVEPVTFEYTESETNSPYIVYKESTLEGGTLHIDYDTNKIRGFGIRFFAFDSNGNPSKIACRHQGNIPANSALDMTAWENAGAVTTNVWMRTDGRFTIAVPSGCSVMAEALISANSVELPDGTLTMQWSPEAEANGTFVQTWVKNGGIKLTVKKPRGNVLFTEQNLTPEQQAQARQNIGIADAAPVAVEADTDELDNDIINASYTAQAERIVRDEQVRQLWSALDATATVLDSGVCGANLTWKLYSSGLLKISGTGRAYDYCKGVLIGKTRAEIEAMVAGGSIPADYAFQAGKTYDDAHGQYVAPWYKYRSEYDWNYTTESAYNAENPKGWKYNRIEIDPGITYIGDWMFYRVCGPVELTIPEGVTKIGRWGIRYSPDLKYVTLPESLTEIEYRGLSRMESLVGIQFGNRLATVGDYGLAQNSALPNIVLPDSLTSIGINLFEGNTALTRANLGSVTSIPSRMCVSLTAFEYVAIPEGVTSIGEYAFFKCGALKKIRIPKKVTTIEANAFYLAEHLKDVYIDSPAIAAAVSGGTSCGYLVNYAVHIYVKDGVACPYAERNFRYDGLVGNYKKYTHPDHVDDKEEAEAVVIATGAFGDAVTYTVSETDTAGEYALRLSGSGATAVEQYVNTPWYGYKDNIVSVEIDNGITTTIANMFREYTKLKTAKVGVAHVPNFMFAKCAALESVDLTGVVTIGQYAFWNTALTQLTIPDTVTTIGENAFLGVSTITKCVVGKNLQTIENNALQLSEATLVQIPATNALKTIGNNNFGNPTGAGMGALNLPNIETIGETVFGSATALESVTIGSRIQSIGANAFKLFNGTATIQAAQGSVTIGAGAFSKVSIKYAG